MSTPGWIILAIAVVVLVALVLIVRSLRGSQLGRRTPRAGEGRAGAPRHVERAQPRTSRDLHGAPIESAAPVTLSAADVAPVPPNPRAGGAHAGPLADESQDDERPHGTHART